MRGLIIISVLAAVIACLGFYYLGQYFGGTFAENITDPVYILSAIGLAFALLFPIQITLPSFLDKFSFLLVFPFLGVWLYFTYQFMTYTDFNLSHIPGDIAYGVNWLKENISRVLIFLLAFSLVALRRWAAPLGMLARETLMNAKDGRSHE